MGAARAVRITTAHAVSACRTPAEARRPGVGSILLRRLHRRFGPVAAKACGSPIVDDQARCLHLSRHDGDESGAAFPLRDIISDAAAHGSAGIVLAHNHPSGDPTPSNSDCRSTRRLATAAEALDCTILDHLVFAGKECASFRQMGLL